jgi:phytoene dehydrogenase-like protein
MSSENYDAIIVGGGHNGLVCAAYLARAGKRTLVIERRHILGGAAVTEEIAPGFKSSTFSYLCGAFYYPIYQDLGLGNYLEVFPVPDVFCPLGDGDYLHANYHDSAITRRSIARLSPDDAIAYDKYREMLAEISPVMQVLMTTIPPDVAKRDYRTLKEVAGLLWKLRRARKNVYRLIDIASQSADDFLSQWFNREEIRAYFAYMASIGNFAGPSTPGSALLMLGYQAARHDKNPRGHVKGGMGSITQALRQIGEKLGARYSVGDPVAEVIVAGGTARGVRTQSGREYRAEIVVSNAHPKILFGRLVAEREVPDEFLHAVRRIRTFSTAWKINVAAEAPPKFAANRPTETGLESIAFSHIGPDVKYLDRAYLDAKGGWYSKKPFVSVVVPTLVDTSMAPKGKHVVHLYGGHAPYDLQDGDWDDERENFAKSVLDVVDSVAPGFSDGIIAKQILTPRDIEAIVGMPHGNIMHGDIVLDQMFSKRPVPGYADYRTPIRGLYQCGSACHPGGGVTGVPGYNAARAILSSR